MLFRSEVGDEGSAGIPGPVGPKGNPVSVSPWQHPMSVYVHIILAYECMSIHVCMYVCMKLCAYECMSVLYALAHAWNQTHSI